MSDRPDADLYRSSAYEISIDPFSFLLHFLRVLRGSEPVQRGSRSNSLAAVARDGGFLRPRTEAKIARKVVGHGGDACTQPLHVFQGYAPYGTGDPERRDGLLREVAERRGDAAQFMVEL